jgi:mannose-1-phosphate guanylyltransferase
MAKLFFGKLNQEATCVAVIMAGGYGTRFWPISRKSKPKQFLSLADNDQSLIQATVSRLEKIVSPGGILVSTGDEHRGLVEEQIPTAAILTEPCSKNTAPCLGYAATKILKDIGDIPIICVPSDHKITEEEKLIECFREAIKLAASDNVLVTLGIAATSPETGYGYIERGEKYSSSGDYVNAYKVQAFKEKPNEEIARQFVNSGQYYWNSGMFIWRPSVLLNAINSHIPELGKSLEAITSYFGESNEKQLIDDVFFKMKPISIDYGVMERASNVVVLPAEHLGWSDVGCWKAWSESIDKNQRGSNGNYLQGTGVFINSNNCEIVGSKRFIASVGLSDVMIVDSDDALLVCKKSHAQDVKEVVELLKKWKRDELL